MSRLDPAALALIIRFETGGRDYYERKLDGPTWPGGASGVTIGFGYDLGYESNITRDWSRYLAPDDLAALRRCAGKTGRRAQQALSGVRGIHIAWEKAAQVFEDGTLPQEIRRTLAVFPGSADRLPAAAFGALVSLVFNRGVDLSGPRRAEMRAIREIIQQEGLTPAERCGRIACELRSMVRLWGEHHDSDNDLCDRRRAEAALVEKAGQESLTTSPGAAATTASAAPTPLQPHLRPGDVPPGSRSAHD